ncbi:MAG: hypothetical protein HUJ99_00845, partial [Bacteroidaceae bacterium]|nr:hypothetical protein [Bacteroidaceae bacterium]
MEVIEQSVIGKCSETICEDGIVVTPDFVAVIDGSTSKSRSGATKTGKTGGQLAMETIRELVLECVSQTDMETFCEEATRRIQQIYTQYYSPEVLPQLKSHPEDRFCCSAVVFSRYWNEIWMIG